MAEFKFVIKCFLFSCLLLAFTQLRTNGITVEARIQNTLLSTAVADFLNQAAAGGARLVEKAMDVTKEKVSGWNLTLETPEPRKQVIHDPAAKKTVDNSDLRKSSEISHDADFNYDTE